MPATQMACVPVGFSASLPAGRVMRAWVEGAELVVWRSTTGKLSAWDNRCPHRGMRLSYGFVRGESLACIYHGWHYGVEGKCNYIPAHPELTPHKNICTVAHTITEQGGILWVSTQDEIDTPSIPQNFQPVRTKPFVCALNSLLEYLADSELIDENGIPLLSTQDTQLPMAVTYQSADSDFAVILLIQKVIDHTTNLHMLCSKNWSVAGKVRLSKWSDSMQRCAEAQYNPQDAAV